MATKLVLLSKLKDGVDPAEYEAWLHAVDFPTTRGAAHITSYEVLRLEGALFGEDSNTEWDYCETIEFTSMDEYMKGLEAPDLANVMEGFGGFVGEFTCLHGSTVD
ncbi:MAG: hypothetical protein JWM47_4474 [Acidimicrobiales bacterium]|nr:hypothetical protein [Acidimicrobiales bacterium]